MLKFVWTPTNVIVLLLRFLLLTIPHGIRLGAWWVAEQLDRLVDWLSEVLPQVKLKRAEAQRDEE